VTLLYLLAFLLHEYSRTTDINNQEQLLHNAQHYSFSGPDLSSKVRAFENFQLGLQVWGGAEVSLEKHLY